MISKEREQIGWVDLLRVLACFLVIIGHSCDPFVSQFDANRTDFLSGVFWGSFVRSSVPLFAMMSAVLLLPVKMDMGQFYRRRLSKILIPLVIWSLITPFLYYLYLHFAATTTSPNIAMADHTWAATLTHALTFIFNFSYTTIPLWYLYMLVGLYLIMPIISAWLVQATKKDVEKFLWIWTLALLLPYIQIAAPHVGYSGNYGNMGLLGVCDWNPYGTFYYFSGFLGYAVWAYYLVKYPLQWSWKRTLATVIPLFVIGYLITVIGFLVTQKYFPAQYANLEIVWYFCGINVFMMTLAVFITVQKMAIKATPFMSRLASYTFGIYLAHFVVVQIGYDFIYPHLHLPPYLQIPLIAIFAFTVTLLLVWLLSKNRFTRRMVA